jgi:nucleoside-diphosphate-sugar epimerase
LKQRIVVLGAAGFIGFHLSKRLSDSNKVDLVLVDNLIRGVEDKEFQKLIEKESVSFQELDLSREIFYKDLFRPKDIVINCAALNGTQNFYQIPVEVLRHSAITSILTGEFAAKNKVSKYIYFGSAESYAGGVNLGITKVPTPENVPLVIDDPENMRWSYAASKTIGEIATIANQKQLGLNAVILRVHNIYGPRMGDKHVIPDLVYKFSKGNFEVQGVHESRAFMYVNDLVNVVLKFIFDFDTFPDLIFNVGSSREIFIKDLSTMIMSELGLAHNIIETPSLEGSVIKRIPDTNKLRNLLEFEETDLKDGIRNYIEWFKSNIDRH